jgi:hypothetical protein
VGFARALADGGPGVGVYVKPTKRSDWRDVPITEQIAEALEQLIDQRRCLLDEDPPGNGFVFSDSIDGSTPLRPDSMSHRWLAGRGASDVTFAKLRSSPPNFWTPPTVTTEPCHRSPATARKPSAAGTTQVPTSTRRRPSSAFARSDASAVIVRMRYHQPTIDYVARRTADGLSKRDIIRCLKRFLAREIYQRVMTDH